MVERLLEIARSEIETKEFPPGSNRVKYNTEYYGDEVSGSQYPWCAVFIWWVFRKAGLSGLYYDGQKTAYVPTLMTWARLKRLTVEEPQAGDIVCFCFSTGYHVGLCESWDGEYVTTIDGNTGTISENNGGCVMRRRRHKKHIAAIIRPQYEREDAEMDLKKMTTEELVDLGNKICEALAEREPSAWSAEAREWAEKSGIIAGDEHGNKQYKKFCTREELIQILYNKEH